MYMSPEYSSSEASSQEFQSLEKGLETNLQTGLSSVEAAKRLEIYGENKIGTLKKSNIFQVLLSQIKEPMIFLLIVIAVLYTIFGNVADSFIIIVIVFLVVIIETINVNRARKSIEALKDMQKPSTLVVRDGSVSKVKTTSLVPGDLVQLTAGERVPADGRLWESFNLQIDESSLTGESLPVLKDSDVAPEGNLLADLTNMAFSGTLVVQGASNLLVTATGGRTELGRISQLVEESEEAETPLEHSVTFLTKVLATLAIAFSVVFPIIGYFQGQSLNDMLLTGLSMAFATIPEELPVLISITLAIGAFTLAKHKAVVKDLKAAETLGSVTVIATDKTGTLTENRMSVGSLYYGGKQIDNPLDSGGAYLRHAILATGTFDIKPGEPTMSRDPMEVSVYEYAMKAGLDLEPIRDSYDLLEEFSFDNRIKLASYLYRKSDNSFWIYVGGAPEVVIERSLAIVGSGGIETPIDQSSRNELYSAVEDLTSRGERVIAISYREVEGHTEVREEVENDLTFLGLVSFVDPARPEVSDAIRQCQIAGINVIMLTGDHPRTAKAIADKVGITNSGKVINGSQLEAMDDTELAEALKEHSVFARITSEDKFRIVKILQKNDEVVAVTGDGVNDSPALQNAEIGIAMGIRGTDVAREASDMILLDDNFATIVDAVYEGRKIQYTLKKSLMYEVSIKLALVMILSVPLFLSIPFPFSPIQIIVMELMMDLGAMGGFLYEREEKDFLSLSSKKRDRNFINRRTLLFTTQSAIAISTAVTVVYLYLFYSGAILVRAQTAAFSVWMLTQVLLAHNLRTEKQPIFFKGILSNRILSLWAILVFLALAIITVVPGLQGVLHTVYLTNWDWTFIILASVISTFWIEIRKLFWHFTRRRREKGSASDI